jgi:uncharacterized membrane protein
MADQPPRTPTPKEIEALLRQLDPKTFDRLTKEQRPQVANLVLTAAFQFSLFSGPLPRPEDLAKYEQILIGSADRIIKMAEQQAAHRQALETNTIAEQVRQSGRGQHYALIVSLALVGSALWLGLTGHPIVGTIFGGGTIVSLATVFLTTRHQQTMDLSEKRTPSKRKAKS